MSDYEINLGKTLKELRNHQGITQKELGKQLDLTSQAYSRYETGDRLPDLKMACRIARYYHITLDQLVRTPFSEDEFKESIASYHVSYRSGTNDILYLTDEEIRFVLEYRGAEWERQHLVAYVLHQMNPQGRCLDPLP